MTQLISNFRPWGELEWLCKRWDASKKWSLFSCLSAEDRSTSVVECLTKINALKDQCFIKILDPESEHTDKINSKIAKAELEYTSIVGESNKNIVIENLLTSGEKIVSTINPFLNKSHEDLIIDVSCLPKRFFYAYIKIAISNPAIRNLIISYGSTLSYLSKELAEDPEPWDHLPLFGPIDYPEPTPKHAIVGIGFIPFSLSKLLKDRYNNIPITFLFPFPPGPPFFQRSWEFLRIIEKNYNLKPNDQILRINAVDVSDVFNHIKSITNNATEPSIFAPYGPKPMSVAIALYAAITNSPVYYTQPKKYHPNYSDGKGKVFAYVIKQNGKLLYEL